MIVADVMSAAPQVVEVNEKLRSVQAKLRELDVRHLPVVDRGRLVGIISERDLPTELSVPAARDAAGRSDKPAGWFMSSDVLSVHPQAELADAIDLMLEHRIGAVPVVEMDEGRLVGIVSYVDVLREARRVL